MTEKADYQQLVQKLKNKTENKHCADCLCQDTEWASINLGVFICINCSGVHRSMGTHVSKIRSIQLDEWDEKNYKVLSEQGNIKANSYWECNLFVFEKPLQHDPYSFRKKFILDKYVKKLYVPSEANIATLKLERDFDTDILNKKGFLTKQGGQRKTWKKRYCVLHGDTLSYFTGKDTSYPKGKIVIEEDATVMFVDENQVKQKFCFAIVTSKRNYYMFADSETDMLDWVYCLRGAVYYTNLKKVFNDPRNFLKGNVSKSIEKSGILKKMGGSIRSMKKRFFVLKDDVLHYYKGEKDLEPVGSIKLKGSKINRENKKKGEYGIAVHTPERQYYLVAQSELEQQEWLNILSQVTNFVSESQLIKQKSLQVHNLILNRMVHGKEISNEPISCHSPLMWRSFSFHRSRPQYLATGYVNPETVQGTMSTLGNSSQSESQHPALMRKASILGKKSEETISLFKRNSPGTPTSTPTSTTPSSASTNPQKVTLRKATVTSDISEISLVGKKKPIVTLKKTQETNTHNTKDMDAMLKNASVIPATSPPSKSGSDSDDDFEDLSNLIENKETSSKKIQKGKDDDTDSEQLTAKMSSISLISEDEGKDDDDDVDVEDDDEDDDDEGEISMGKIEIQPSEPIETKDSPKISPFMITEEEIKKKREKKPKKHRTANTDKNKKKTSFRRMHAVVEEFYQSIEVDLD